MSLSGFHTEQHPQLTQSPAFWASGGTVKCKAVLPFDLEEMGGIPVHFINIYWPHRSRRNKILSSIADFPGNHAIVWLYGIDFSERFFCAYSTSVLFPITFLVWFPLTFSVLVFLFGVLSHSYLSCLSLCISPDLTAHVPVLNAKCVCIAQPGLFQILVLIPLPYQFQFQALHGLLPWCSKVLEKSLTAWRGWPPSQMF